MLFKRNALIINNIIIETYLKFQYYMNLGRVVARGVRVVVICRTKKTP